MKYSNWIVPERAPEIPEALLREGFTPLLAAMLAKRGMATLDSAREFIYCGEELLLPAEDMAGMPKAAQRVREAIERRETVAVYGDYDVDGITSACLVTSYLRSCGLECIPYIPDRLEEGYGLNSAALDSVKAQGATLVITVDCGITAVNEAEHAKELGLDLIITDHHECGSGALRTLTPLWTPSGPTARIPTRAWREWEWPSSCCVRWTATRRICSAATPTWWPQAPWPTSCPLRARTAT